MEIPDALAQRAKTAAVRRGMTLRALVTQALEHHLDAAASKPAGRHIRFPLVASRQPATLLLTPAEIQDILLREEAAAYETAQRR